MRLTTPNDAVNALRCCLQALPAPWPSNIVSASGTPCSSVRAGSALVAVASSPMLAVRLKAHWRLPWAVPLPVPSARQPLDLYSHGRLGLDLLDALNIPHQSPADKSWQTDRGHP